MKIAQGQGQLRHEHDVCTANDGLSRVAALVDERRLIMRLNLRRSIHQYAGSGRRGAGRRGWKSKRCPGQSWDLSGRRTKTVWQPGGADRCQYPRTCCMNVLVVVRCGAEGMEIWQWMNQALYDTTYLMVGMMKLYGMVQGRERQ